MFKATGARRIARPTARPCASAFGAAALIAIIAMPAGADDLETKTQVCGACHGQNGVPISPTIPIIWGQKENYLVKEIHDYRAGDRKNPIMSPVAAGIAQPDTRPIAAYFAAKPWPAKTSSGTPSADPPAPPADIAEKLNQCRACHQPNFEGGPPAPRLAGLSYDYLALAMLTFANGERTNNGDMPKIMQALTPAERDAMAKYIAGL